MVRASDKSSGLLGRGALATLSKNPDDLNNGIQLVVPAHIFHFMVPLVRIGEQKRRFCEAVNCERSEQEGKFFFAMLVSFDFL